MWEDEFFWSRGRIEGTDESSDLDFYEVKLDASRISLAEHERKRTAFFEKTPHLKSHDGICSGLSLAAM